MHDNNNSTSRGKYYDMCSTLYLRNKSLVSPTILVKALMQVCTLIPSTSISRFLSFSAHSLNALDVGFT